MRVALVNTNRIKPPVSPIGLEYVAEAMHAASHAVDILDLCRVDDPSTAIANFFKDAEYGLIGLTLRNTDDCAFTGRQSFLGDARAIVQAVKRHTSAPVFMGGAGFSVMPATVLEHTGADAGVWGEGEWALPACAALIASGKPWNDVPGIVARGPAGWRAVPPERGPHNTPAHGLHAPRSADLLAVCLDR
ncbi:MAG: cobalamin B12-binding domain-containing protein [Planctomycetota bacterium]